MVVVAQRNRQPMFSALRKPLTFLDVMNLGSSFLANAKMPTEDAAQSRHATEVGSFSGRSALAHAFTLHVQVALQRVPPADVGKPA